MSSNWMWGVLLVAAAAHALRWVPPRATLRQVKIPATFVVLYVLYAAALAVGGLMGLLVALLVVEVLLQLVRRRRGDAAAARDTVVGRRR